MSRRLSRAGLVMAALLLAATPSLSEAQALKEPSSGVKFKVHRSLQGRPHTCIGVGLRKAFVFFKVYAAGMYIDDATGKPAFAKLLASVGGDLKKLRGRKRLHDWLITGDFGKSMEWVLTRDLEKGKMTKVIRESLERELGDLNAPGIKPHVDKFLKAMDVPLKKWQRVVVCQRPGSELTAALNGRRIVSVRNKRIVQAIWRIYFGPHPVQADLKKNLAQEIHHLR